MGLSRWIWLLVVGLPGWVSEIAAQDTNRAPDQPAYRADPNQRVDLYFRSVALSDQPPADVRCDAKYRGARQWFGQIRYGSGDSIRLAVVVDERPDGVDLYLDRHRGREIDSTCVLDGNGPDWVVEVETHLGHESVAAAKRTVLLRWGPVTKSLGIATLGNVECTTSAGGKFIAVRRLDGDGNGLFNDFADVIMLDIDGDGLFSPIDEQFLFRPIVSIAGSRMAVRSDPLSGAYRLERLTDIGAVSIEWPSHLPPVSDFAASLVSPDGVALAIDSTGLAHEAPAGTYRLESLQFVLTDPDNRRWQYVFIRPYAAETRSNEAVEVKASETTKLSPLAETTFALEPVDPTGAVKRGRLMQLQPVWTIFGGLRINSVTIRDGSKPPSQPLAKVQLLNQAGEDIGSDTCGFF